MEIGSIFRGNGAAITFCRALRRGPLPLLPSGADYEWRVPWPSARDALPSRDVRLHDAWPLHCDAERHEYDVPTLYDDVPQLFLTFGFLQWFLRFLGFPRFIAKTEHR
jgi:hypothetical protein